MLVGLAILVAILGLSILIPTRKKLRRMQEINNGGQSVTGIVVSTNDTRNVLGGPLYATTHEAEIHYLPPGTKDPYKIYRLDHNLVMSKEFSAGQRMEVVFDAANPYKAYPKPEWERALQDMKRSKICFGASVALLLIDQILKWPG